MNHENKIKFTSVVEFNYFLWPSDVEFNVGMVTSLISSKNLIINIMRATNI